MQDHQGGRYLSPDPTTRHNQIWTRPGLGDRSTSLGPQSVVTTAAGTRCRHTHYTPVCHQVKEGDG
jgi:hypothetical protein